MCVVFLEELPLSFRLQGKTSEELSGELRKISKIFRQSKAEFILECARADGDTSREFQDSRDFITSSLVLDLEHQKVTLAQLDKEIEKVLLSFDYKLTSMPGIGIAVASKLIAEIGDIRRFANADKLTRYAGVAHVKSAYKCIPLVAGGWKQDNDKTPMVNLTELILAMFLKVTLYEELKEKSLVKKISKTHIIMVWQQSTGILSWVV